MTLATLPSISISQADFQTMVDFAQVMYRMKHHKVYIQKMQETIASVAHVQAAYPSVLMGFDFHTTTDGPKLIEINNNAAGLLSWKTHQWLEQPSHIHIQGDLETRINGMFPDAWVNIAIMDDQVTTQFFYPEMVAYAKLLSEHGRSVVIVSPEDLRLHKDGSLYVGSQKIDGIYNRHTDFYLKSPEMRHIHQAYVAQKVGLTPHPRSYALIGDKHRMVDWWTDGFLDDILSFDEKKLVLDVVPSIYNLGDMDKDEAWSNRKQYVFKPAASHGGKGVLIGKSVRQKRFQAMLENPEHIVVQSLVPAPTVDLDDEIFKYDIRLYMSGEKLIGLAARLFQGSVTNFRHPKSGFYPVEIV